MSLLAFIYFKSMLFPVNPVEMFKLRSLEFVQVSNDGYFPSHKLHPSTTCGCLQFVVHVLYLSSTLVKLVSGHPRMRNSLGGFEVHLKAGIKI